MAVAQLALAQARAEVTALERLAASDIRAAYARALAAGRQLDTLERLIAASEEQVRIMTVSEKFSEYGKQVEKQFREAGLRLGLRGSEFRCGVASANRRSRSLGRRALRAPRDVPAWAVAARQRPY